MEYISSACSNKLCQNIPELLCKCQDPPLPFCNPDFNTHLLDGRAHQTESATRLTTEQLAATKNNIHVILQRLQVIELQIIAASNKLIAKITSLSSNALNQINLRRKSLYSSSQLCSSYSLCFESIRRSIETASTQDLQSNFDLRKIDEALVRFFSPSRLFTSESCINSYPVIDVRLKSQITSTEKKLRLLMNAGIYIDRANEIATIIHSEPLEIIIVGSKSAAITVIDLISRNRIINNNIGAGTLNMTDIFVFSSNRSILLVCKESLIILGLQTLEILAERRIETKQIEVINIFPRRSMIVTGSYNGIIKVWDNGLNQTHEYNSHHSFGFFGCLTCIGIASDESFIVSGGLDGKIGVWRFTNDPHLFLAHNECVSMIFVAPNCKVVISGSKSKIKLWDFCSNYQIIWEKKLTIQNLVFGLNEDLTEGFMTGDKNQIYLFNFITNREQARIETKDQLAQLSNRFQEALNFSKFLKKK